MRLIVLCLSMTFLAGCASGQKTASNGTSPRSPASEGAVACNPNHFNATYLEILRSEISKKYGEDFGARCIESTDSFKYDTEGCAAYRVEACKSLGNKARAKCSMKDLDDVFVNALRSQITKRYGEDFGARCTEIKTKFTYDTEGCDGYRKEACAAATDTWISTTGKALPPADAGY